MSKRTCSINGCGNKHCAKGYCNRHYKNMHLFGNPLARHERSLEMCLREAGWTVLDTGCWEWNGSRNANGYGIFTAAHLGYDRVGAHRVMYEFLVAPVPGGLFIRHECDNPPCVNPGHLVPGTHEDNMRDMRERGRSCKNTLTCGNGHDMTKPGAARKIARSWGIEIACAECTRARNRRWAQKAALRQKNLVIS